MWTPSRRIFAINGPCSVATVDAIFSRHLRKVSAASAVVSLPTRTKSCVPESISTRSASGEYRIRASRVTAIHPRRPISPIHWARHETPGRGRAFSSRRDHQVCQLLRVFYTAMVTPIIEIRLPAALEKIIASQVREGRYRSREAAIVAAVRHLKQRNEQLVWLRSEIQNGLDSGPAGELNIEGTIRRGRRRLAARSRRARS